MYAATVTGASKAVREVVNAVQDIKSQNNEIRITYSELAKWLDVHREIARRHAKTAIRLGWLTNNEIQKGRTADLVIGEEMPPATGLPAPDTLNALSQGRVSECDKLLTPEILAAIGEEDSEDVFCHSDTPKTGVSPAYLHQLAAEAWGNSHKEGDRE